MKKSLLPTTRKNQAFEEIKKHGLDPRDFEWTEAEMARGSGGPAPGIVSKLVHRSSGYSFRFDLRTALPSVAFAPGLRTLNRFERCLDIPLMMSHFAGEWLPALKQEAETPDLWAGLQQTRAKFEAFTGPDAEEKLSDPEREGVIKAIAEVRRWLLEHHRFEQRQAALVDERFEYLTSAVDRMSRRDWLHTAIGVLFTIVVGYQLEPGQAREMFDMAFNALKEVFGEVTKLLP